MNTTAFEYPKVQRRLEDYPLLILVMSEESGHPFDRQMGPIPVFTGSLFPRLL